MPQPLLNAAFRIHWPVNGKDATETVFGHFEEFCAPLRPDKRNRKKSNRRRKRSTKKVVKGKKRDEMKNTTGEKAKANDSLISEEKDEARTFFKKYFVVGVARILRELQFGRLSVVFFDRNLLRPSAVSHFIGAACVSSEAHCVCFDNFSDRFSGILKIKSVAAVGISKKFDDDYPESITNFVQNIISTLKPVIYVSHEETDESRPRKKIRKELFAGDDSATYVEATVTVPGKSKKK